MHVYLTSKTSHRQQIYVLNLIVSVLWEKFKSREWRRTPVCDDLTKEWELWKLSVIIDRYSLFTITMIRCQHATHSRAGDRGGQISVRNPIHLRLSLKTAHPQQAQPTNLCPISPSHNSGEIQKPRIAQDPCDDLIK